MQDDDALPVTDGLQRAWAALRDVLAGEHRQISDEIRDYPQPIPGCDAQYAHLLGERRRLAFEIARARAASADCDALARFLETSPDVGADEARRIRACLGGGAVLPGDGPP